MDQCYILVEPTVSESSITFLKFGMKASSKKIHLLHKYLTPVKKRNKITTVALEISVLRENRIFALGKSFQIINNLKIELDRMARQIMGSAMQSISIDATEYVFNILEREMRNIGIQAPEGGFTSEDLKNYLHRQQIFLPERRDFQERFSITQPEIAITYMWLGVSLKAITKILKRKFNGKGEKLIWIDIIFNDQRNPIAISNSVRMASRIYISAKDHAVLFSQTEYPIYDRYGRCSALKMCEPWDRCWCVFEMGVRDLGVQKFESRESVMILSDEYAERLKSKFDPCMPIADSIRRMFQGRDFLSNMCGRSEDVTEIQKTLIAPDFYGSAASFNSQFEHKLTNFFLSYFPVGQAEFFPEISLTVVTITMRHVVLCSIKRTKAVLGQELEFDCITKGRELCNRNTIIINSKRSPAS